VSVLERAGDGLRFGGVPLETAFAALRRVDPAAHAFYLYDGDVLAARAERVRAAFAAVGEGGTLVAYAIKANGLAALLERFAAAGLGADAGSLGELALAEAAGFAPARRVLNGNGRTPEEAEWVARHGVHSVNADHVAELDGLERAAAEAGARVRVALRVNPGIDPGGHRYIATGDDEAKFGVAPDDALAALAAAARWPHLVLDGLHQHVGSQIMDVATLEEEVDTALAMVDEARRRGAIVRLVNLGGGFGVDYSGAGREFPLESWGMRLAERAAGRGLEWVVEPGRWLVAPAGVLVSEVLHVKRRAGRRFVVLAAGMNDLIRPALYQAFHRIEPARVRPGPVTPALVVGPVCESGDAFASLDLPPLEPGDLVVLHDAGAYGASMASNYNGRGRLAEVVAAGGNLVRARAAETARELLARRDATPLDPERPFA
jgi:diaminopimelate decarboxylase